MSFFCQSFLFLFNVNISHTHTYPQINYLSRLPFTHRQTYISSQMHAHFHMYVHTPCAGSQLEAVRVCVLPAGDDVITSEQWGRPAYKHRKWCPDRRPADTLAHTHTLLQSFNSTIYIKTDAFITTLSSKLNWIAYMHQCRNYLSRRFEKLLSNSFFSLLNVNAVQSWIATILMVKYCTFIIPSSNMKHFQWMLGLHKKSAERQEMFWDVF